MKALEKNVTTIITRGRSQYSDFCIDSSIQTIIQTTIQFGAPIYDRRFLDRYQLEKTRFFKNQPGKLYFKRHHEKMTLDIFTTQRPF